MAKANAIGQHWRRQVAIHSSKEHEALRPGLLPKQRNALSEQLLETARSRLEDLSLTVAQLRSNIEDADIAEVTLDISRFESLYQASLIMASRINELSLLNFI